MKISSSAEWLQLNNEESKDQHVGKKKTRQRKMLALL